MVEIKAFKAKDGQLFEEKAECARHEFQVVYKAKELNIPLTKWTDDSFKATLVYIENAADLNQIERIYRDYFDIDVYYANCKHDTSFPLVAIICENQFTATIEKVDFVSFLDDIKNLYSTVSEYREFVKEDEEK